MLFFVLLQTLALFCSAYSIAAFFIADNFFLFAIFHLLTVISSTISFLLLYKRNFVLKNNWAIFNAFFVFCIPLYGQTSFLCLFTLVQVWKNKEKRITQDMENYIALVSSEKTGDEKAIEREYIQRGINIQPLTSIFLGNNTILKRSAVVMLNNSSPEEAIKLLRIAVLDKDQEVKLQAAQQINKYDERFQEDIRYALEEINNDPSEIETHKILARSYLRYIESGLLDESSKQYYSLLLNDELNSILTAAPNNFFALHNLGKLFLELKNYPEAKDLLNKSLAVYPDSYEAKKDLLQLYFEIKDFSSVSNLLNQFDEDNFPQEFEQMKEFWENNGQ